MTALENTNTGVENIQVVVMYCEGSYQYTVDTIILPEDDEVLFSAISKRLDSQFNYRTTDGTLWCNISDGRGEDLFRCTRLSEGVIEVWDMLGDVRFTFEVIEYHDYEVISDLL